MVKRDLDILGMKSTDSITLFDKERPIARLKTKDYVKVQSLMQEMAALAGKSDEELKELDNEQYPIFKQFIPDLTRKEFDEMNLAQRMGVFSFIDELFLIDQGIPEEQVSEIKKQLETQRMNILLQNIGNEENIG